MHSPVSLSFRILFLFVLLLSGLCIHSDAQASKLGKIEALYAVEGPYGVTSQTVKDDNGKKLYEIFYPQEMTSDHPIITWGNGTGATPASYDELLAHLASWGFVVIDAYERNTGSGAEILDAAEYLAAQNSEPGSEFYHHLDPSSVGAAGHSQGATGVINAQTNFPGGSLITTVVSIALPSLSLSDPQDKYDTSALEAPFFIMGGTRDTIISPVKTNTKAYAATDNRLPAAMGMSKGAGHNEILGDGGKHRGYLTAWMMFQLRGDPVAAEAFSGRNPEIANNNGWQTVKTQNLP